MDSNIKACYQKRKLLVIVRLHRMESWKNSFTKGAISWKDEWTLRDHLTLATIAELKAFIDLAHIRYCLLRPFFETKNYPLVESRELLPSFDPDLFEFKQLPGFSLVALARPLNYFSEVFQFDLMPAIHSGMGEEETLQLMRRNFNSVRNRLHRGLHQEFHERFEHADTGSLENYSAMIPFLNTMDRAQVMGLNNDVPDKTTFRLHGIYASLPSDLDTEIKRFGLRIGKFAVGDNAMYDANRFFVYQYLMELYGFPIASERRTSAALFARRLHKMGEKFIIRTLGQSDRTLTTLWNEGHGLHYPNVEKIALVAVDKDQDDILPALKNGGYFVDEKRRVVILKVGYKQHKFNADNVRQDRALSVTTQGVVHPVTGKVLDGVNIIKDTSNMFLRLNDIVRGEYNGYIVYKRAELIENTDTEEKKLKFLYAWLSKHQRRIIGYSDEFFSNVVKVLDNYLLSPDNYEMFYTMRDLYQEVVGKFSYIQQARKVRILEDLQTRIYKGKRIGYAQMLEEIVKLMHALKFEIVTYFDNLVEHVINIGQEVLEDKYLLRTYINRKDSKLNERQLGIKKDYGRIVTLVDELKAIRKARSENISEQHITPVQQAV